jgi:iron(III) transport system substrate-binding protein
MFSITRRGLLRAGAAAGVGVAISRVPALAADETLLIYNGQHRKLTDAVVAAFTKATGVKVTVRQGGSSQLSNQISEEGANSPADVFFSEQSPPIAALDEQGLLAPTAAETLKQIPAAYASPNKTWIASTMRVRVLVYNKDMLKESDLPDSVLDVTSAAWKGKIGYVTRDGFEEQVMAIAKLKDKDAALGWLKGLHENGRKYSGNSAAMRAVEAGEIASALINNYYWFALAKENGADKLKSAVHYFKKGDPGSLINLSPAAMLKTSKKPELAQKFLDYLVSEEGQKVAVASYAEYPVRPGITSPYPLKPLAEIGCDVTPADVGSAKPAIELMKQAGIL